MPRHVPAVLVVVALAVATAGCGGSSEAVVRPEPMTTFTAEVPVLLPGAPGEPGEVVEPGQSRSMPNADYFGDGDITFMSDMVVHHAQALRMAELAPERVDNDQVRRLAERISAAQGPEITAMTGWLEARGLPVPDVHAAGHVEHGDMPGMATAQDMTRLVAAQGRGFDRLFLQMMIRHHEGALQMVDSAGAEHPQVVDAVSDTGVTQSVEIRRMQELLAGL